MPENVALPFDLISTFESPLELNINNQTWTIKLEEFEGDSKEYLWGGLYNEESEVFRIFVNTNTKNVLRGIHGDYKTWKLVSCPFGEIEQVVVDLRSESPNFKKWIKFYLNQKNLKAILIPPGFGNAFCVNSNNALYHYKLAYDGKYNDFNKQFTYAWNDETIGIDWSVKDPITSDRDMR